MKKYLYSLIVLLLVGLFASCDTDSTEADEITSAKISQIYIENDSLTDMTSYYFTIDTTDADHYMIYNEDSIYYGANLDSMTINLLTSAETVMIGDEYYNTSDTVFFDLSHTPIMIKTYPPSGTDSLEYEFTVNVHQVDPDSMHWLNYSSNLYTETATAEGLVNLDDALFFYHSDGTTLSLQASSDHGKTWNMQTVNGLPASIDLRHFVVSNAIIYAAEGQDLYSSTNGFDWQVTKYSGAMVSHLLYAFNDKIYGLMETPSELTLVSLASGADTWSEVTLLPDDFPVEGECSFLSTSGSGLPRMSIFGGKDKDGQLLNSLWVSENMSVWVNLALESTLEPRTDAFIAKYDERLMLLGGTDADGLVSNQLLFSIDFGLNWDEPSDSEVLYSTFTSRTLANVALLSTGEVVVVSGQDDSGYYIKDVWKGLLNKAIPDFEE